MLDKPDWHCYKKKEKKNQKSKLPESTLLLFRLVLHEGEVDPEVEVVRGKVQAGQALLVHVLFLSSIKTKCRITRI